MKSLPPSVSGKTRWILDLNFNSSIKYDFIKIQWWGSAKQTIKERVSYEIKCTLVQFNEYLKDLDFVLIELYEGTKEKKELLGTCDFEPILNPPTTRFNIPIMKNKIKIGNLNITARISTSTKIPVVQESKKKPSQNLKQDRESKNEPMSNQSEPPIEGAKQEADILQEDTEMDHVSLGLDEIKYVTPNTNIPQPQMLEHTELLSVSEPQQMTVLENKEKDINIDFDELDFDAKLRQIYKETEINLKRLELGKSVETLSKLDEEEIKEFQPPQNENKEENNLQSKPSNVIQDSGTDTTPNVSDDSLSDMLSELEYFDVDKDEDLVRILNSKHGKSLIEDESIQSSLPSEKLETPKLQLPQFIHEKLLNVFALNMNMSSLELSNVQCPTSIWIEYEIKSLTESNSTRLQQKVPIPYKTPKLIKLNHQKTHPISKFDINSVIDFKIYAIAAKKYSVMGKVKESNDEIWRCYSQYKLADLVYCTDFKSKQELLITLEGGANKPWDVYGTLHVDFELLLQGTPKTLETVKQVPEATKTRYFNIHISTISSVQPPVNPSLLYVTFKLFNAETIIKTIPLKHHPDFNLTTGQLNPPLDFAFSHTIPVQSIDAKFLVLEVRCIGVKDSLLGLVKLPVYLLTGQGFVQVPETEYPIYDLFGGSTNGWLKVGLKLGQLSDILPKEPKKEEAIIETKPPVIENKSPPKVEITKQNVECVIQLDIHQACGIYGLLKAARAVFPEVVSMMDNLPEVIVQFDLFPPSDPSDIIQTEPVYSFIPEIEYSVQLVLDKIDSGLIKWSRTGKCEGKIICGGTQVGDFSVPADSLFKDGFSGWVEIIDVNGEANGGILVDMKLLNSNDLKSIATQIHYVDLEVEVESVGQRVVCSLFNSIGNADLVNGKCSIMMENVSIENTNQCKLRVQVESDTVWHGFVEIPVKALLQDCKTVKNRGKYSEMSYSGLLIDPESIDLGGNGISLVIRMKTSAIKSNIDKSKKTHSVTQTERNLANPPKLPILVESKSATQIPIENGSVLTGPDNLDLQKIPERTISKPAPERTIPLYITIEKAMNLPLLEDPLAQSLSSPFVSNNITQTVPPNCKVVFTDGNKSFETPIIRGQTNPNWSHSFQILIPNTHESLLSYKTLKTLDFKVVSVNDGIEDLIGTCQVSTSLLFSGVCEIYGWYPIKNSIIVGQLMIRVYPGSNLLHCLQEYENVDYGIYDDVIPQSISTEKRLFEKSVPENPQTSFVKSKSSNCSVNSLQSKSVRSKSELKNVTAVVPASQNVDTWVWDGVKWDHRQVDKMEPANSNLEAPTPDPVFIPELHVDSFGKSISETVKDLDQLTKNMMERLNNMNIDERLKNVGASNEKDQSFVTNQEKTMSPLLKLSDLDEESINRPLSPIMDLLLKDSVRIEKEDSKAQASIQNEKKDLLDQSPEIVSKVATNSENIVLSTTEKTLSKENAETEKFDIIGQKSPAKDTESTQLDEAEIILPPSNAIGEIVDKYKEFAKADHEELESDKIAAVRSIIEDEGQLDSKNIQDLVDIKQPMNMDVTSDSFSSSISQPNSMSSPLKEKENTQKPPLIPGYKQLPAEITLNFKKSTIKPTDKLQTESTIERILANVSEESGNRIQKVFKELNK